MNPIFQSTKFKRNQICRNLLPRFDTNFKCNNYPLKTTSILVEEKDTLLLKVPV